MEWPEELHLKDISLFCLANGEELHSTLKLREFQGLLEHGKI
jgi:hypothetical protein